MKNCLKKEAKPTEIKRIYFDNGVSFSYKGIRKQVFSKFHLWKSDEYKQDKVFDIGDESISSIRITI